MEDISYHCQVTTGTFQHFFSAFCKKGEFAEHKIKVPKSRPRVDLSSSFGPAAALAGHTAPSVSPLQSHQANNHYLVQTIADDKLN